MRFASHEERLLFLYRKKSKDLSGVGQGRIWAEFPSFFTLIIRTLVSSSAKLRLCASKYCLIWSISSGLSVFPRLSMSLSITSWGELPPTVWSISKGISLNSTGRNWLGALNPFKRLRASLMFALNYPEGSHLPIASQWSLKRDAQQIANQLRLLQ